MENKVRAIILFLVSIFLAVIGIGGVYMAYKQTSTEDTISFIAVGLMFIILTPIFISGGISSWKEK